MVSFVGAGCGAADLITVRGMRLLQEADLVIYAGSLVNPELLSYTKKGCECLNSAYMTLDEVIDALQRVKKKERRWCAFIQVIRAFMVQFVSRWIVLKSLE